MDPKELTPTNIRINKKKNLMHTRIVSTFMLGFEHELTYERQDRFIGGDIIITLDGREELVRESMFSLGLGSFQKHFNIEGESIGHVKILGIGLGLLVKVSVNGVSILEA
jgi:hypothetical protein